MQVLLIAGHGNGDPGAVGNGYREDNLTRQMATLIRQELSKYCAVTIADTSQNWYRKIIKFGEYFNFKPYDYVFEIHLNSSYGTNADGVTTGTEIYVTREEKNVFVEENIVRNVAKLGFKNRGVKRKNYDLINYIKKQGVSSALWEVCFISDADDMKLYTAKKRAIAQAVADGIVEGFALHRREEKDMTKQEVIAIIEEYEKNKAKQGLSPWARDGFNAAADKGIMDGSAPKSFVTREMLATVLHRLGFFK